MANPELAASNGRSGRIALDSPPATRPAAGARNDSLRDFTTDRRVLLLIAMAVAVGTGAAGAAWLLLKLIAVATNLAYFGRLSAAPVDIANTPLGFASVFVPVAGAIIIGFMARYGSEKIRGHGIPEAMEAILIGGSRIQPKVAVLKPISSAVSIGTGGPFGAEGPIIMTGGAIGSLFAQFFHMSAAERKSLLVAGAAGGMAATFGTPVAAVLLAVELLLFEWKPRSFIPVAVAAAVAAAWRAVLLEPGALFPMTFGVALPWWGLIACAAVGIAAGLASGVLTALVYGFEDFFQRLPIHWMWWPAIGGLVVGLGGLIDPRALGVGYANIASLLHGGMLPPSALLLLAVKAVIWSVALGSGTSGGVLAPLLMMGGALGAIEAHFIPAGTVGFWALLGMAAIMGGTMRAPLTATAFALELTHDIDALLPLLVACTAAYALTVLLLKRSILTEKVARRGHHVLREYIVDPFETMRVAEVMVTKVDTLPAAMPVGDAIAFFTAADSGDGIPERRHKSYPVIDEAQRVVGLVSRADALRLTVTGWTTDATLGDIAAAPDEIVMGHPDELVGRLADRMAAADVGRVPVIRQEDGVLVGIVARKDLLRVRARLLAHERERQVVIDLARANRRGVAGDAA